MQRAIDHQPRHLFHYHLEVKLRNPVALEIWRRVQKIDRVRHVILHRKFDRVHFISERLIDRLRVLHDARAHRRGQIFVLHQSIAAPWDRNAPAQCPFCQT